MKIYVASSWRNQRQPEVVQTLRQAGHEVYDFKNPEINNHGFHWSEIDPQWLEWNGEKFRSALMHPIALSGFRKDHDAMYETDVFVMVLPCGRSAHLELGWATGRNKTTFILLDEYQEPELMYLEADYICLSIDEVIGILNEFENKSAQGVPANK